MLKKLNPANPESSEIKYQISAFPDGQQSVTITDAPAFLQGHNVMISSRLNSFKDLELIICTTQALRNMAVSTVSLYVPYFLGARSDRKFSEGGVNYLKQVICPIINSQNFSRVTVLDPHSDVLEACLNNFQKISSVNFSKEVIKELDDIIEKESGAKQTRAETEKLTKSNDLTKIGDLYNKMKSEKKRIKELLK